LQVMILAIPYSVSQPSTKAYC